jgi:hypothetical protein
MPANIDTGGFFVQTDGSICIGVANNIYRCAVTTTSSKAYNINGLQSFTSYTISVNTRNTENNISLPVTTTYSTLLPEPTYLIATGRTTNSIDISFNKSAGTIDRYTVNATYSGGSITPQTITPSIDSNAYQTYTITGLISNTKYTINVYATRGSVNSSYSNNIVDYSTLVVQTASFSTNPFTNVFTSVTAGISSLSINNNRTRITVSSTSQQNIYYYTYNGTAWVRNAVSISIPSIISMAMTPDGSRGVIGGSDNKCYYFTLTGSTYSTLRQTLDTRSLGLCRGIDITDNGNTIVYTDEVTNSIYFAKWNESAINYDAFTKTLDISRNTYYGLGISSDGSKIAYGQSPGNKVYVAYWNDSDNNYGVGTPITFLGSKFARHIRFSPNGNVIYMSMLNDLNGSIQYSIFNIDTYSTFKYVPTTILQANVDIAGIYVDPSGVFIFRGQAIHLITPTYTPPAT